MKNKKIVIILGILLVLLITICILLKINLSKNNNVNSNPEIINNEEQVAEGKIDIIDINSKTRPYAVVINNTPVAVGVQTGLNNAYLIYEIPTEGNTSRLLALYKDVSNDVKIGTIRSARHNFIDYALESDAILVHYGWSHYAESEEKGGAINYINGLFDNSFWRENPEKLASEHTAYTSIEKIKNMINTKGFNTNSDSTILLNYSSEDINLTQKSNNKIANTVVIKYDSGVNVTSFKYDTENKVYYRLENNNYCTDYDTKEKVNTKNIIVQKLNHEKCDDGYYWNLKNVGTGEGYYITNGYAVPITWKKDSREGKTKYYYDNGEEIQVSDGRTYIEIQTTNQNLIIE